MSEYWALNDEGRLYIPNLTPESIPYDIYDRSASSWYLDSETDRIDADIIPDAVHSSSPFPMGVWYMQSNRKLHAGGIPDKIYGQSPYPQGVWYLKSAGQIHAGGMPFTLGWQLPYLPSVWSVNETLGRPDFGAYPDNELLGSFANASGMGEVVVNANLRSIGKYSFRNTVLEEISIPTDCTYEDTSFPEGCVVNPIL